MSSITLCCLRLYPWNNRNKNRKPNAEEDPEADCAPM